MGCITAIAYRWLHAGSQYVRTDRSARRPSRNDPEPLSKINFPARISPFLDSLYPYQAYWELCILGVHPDAGGRGIGRTLAEWGLRRASEEGIPACVVSAVDTEGFYQRCGFRSLLGRCSEVELEGLVNPLKARGLGGGAMLCARAAGEDS